MSSYSGGEEDLVDVEKRKRQAEYTLGDPLLFPLEFINWLKRYVEQSGIMLPASQIFGLPKPGAGGGGAGSTLEGYPPGLVFPFTGATPPAGSLPADGSLKNIADYPDLYAILGDTWGIHTATQFYLPDLRDRALHGAGPQMPVGMTDGRPVGSRGPWHHHNINIDTDARGGHSHGGSADGVGDHTHPASTGNDGVHKHDAEDGSLYALTVGTTAPLGSGGTNRYIIASLGGFTANDGNHSHAVSVGNGGGHGHSLSISGVGDHQHNASGASTGGGSLDVGGFAAILYVITTG